MHFRTDGGFGRIEVANLAMVGWSLHFLNQLERSLDLTLAAAESSRKVGDRRAELNATSCAVYVMHQMGEMRDAPGLIERVQELVEHLGAIARIGEQGAFSTAKTQPIEEIVGRAPLTTRQFVEDHKAMFS